MRAAASMLLVAAGAALPARAETMPSADARAAIDGRVVDAASGQPLAGTVVQAVWWTDALPDPATIVSGIALGGHGGSDLRVAYIQEALTDADGRFAIPAFGASDQWSAGTLTAASPVLRFIKPGYLPAATGRARWDAGRPDAAEGIRAPHVMALYRPGERPRADLGFVDPSIATPDAALAAVRNLQVQLDIEARAAAGTGAGASSPARQRAVQAQAHARASLDEELRRLTAQDAGAAPSQRRNP
jgi:hypothetical protein